MALFYPSIPTLVRFSPGAVLLSQKKFRVYTLTFLMLILHSDSNIYDI